MNGVKFLICACLDLAVFEKKISKSPKGKVAIIASIMFKLTKNGVDQSSLCGLRAKKFLDNGLDTINWKLQYVSSKFLCGI